MSTAKSKATTRVHAERVNFQAYFDSCKVSEPVSQRGKPYHNLPKNPGAGCYILLADFSSARIKWSVEDKDLNGIFAFYFGKAGGKGLTDRGQAYYQPSSGSRVVNQLIESLWEHKVPVVHMCSQIPLSQGKGILEAMMLDKFDFCTNYSDNDGYRVSKGARPGIFEQFALLCSDAGEQQQLQHSDFFKATIGRHDTDVQEESRQLSVRLQEAYSAIEAAEKAGVMKKTFQLQLNRLQLLQKTALQQIQVHLDTVDNCHEKLKEIKACKEYFGDERPLFVPPTTHNSPSLAWKKSRRAAKWAHQAYGVRKELAEVGHSQATVDDPVDKAPLDSDDEDDIEILQKEHRATAQPKVLLLQNNFMDETLYAKLTSDLAVNPKQKAFLRGRILNAAKNNNNDDLWSYLLSFKGLTPDRVKHYACLVVGGVPLHPLTYEPCLTKYEFMLHVAEQLPTEAAAGRIKNTC